MIVTWIATVTDPTGTLSAEALRSLLRKKVKSVTVGGYDVGQAYKFFTGTTAWDVNSKLRCYVDFDTTKDAANNSSGMLIGSYAVNFEQLVSSVS